MAIDVGDVRRCIATFKDINGTAANPSTIKFKILVPGGSVTSYTYGTDAEVVLDSTGVYHVDWTIDTGGKHIYRWEGTGAVTAAEEGSFLVRGVHVST